MVTVAEKVLESRVDPLDYPFVVDKGHGHGTVYKKILKVTSFRDQGLFCPFSFGDVPVYSHIFRILALDNDCGPNGYKYFLSVFPGPDGLMIHSFPALELIDILFYLIFFPTRPDSIGEAGSHSRTTLKAEKILKRRITADYYSFSVKYSYPIGRIKHDPFKMCPLPPKIIFCFFPF